MALRMAPSPAPTGGGGIAGLCVWTGGVHFPLLAFIFGSVCFSPRWPLTRPNEGKCHADKIRFVPRPSR